MVGLKVDEEIDIIIFEQEHAGEFFHLIDKNRGYLRIWLPWIDDIRFTFDAQRFITANSYYFSNSNGYHTGIWYKKKLAGSIGFIDIDWDNKITSIGYWVDLDFQGHGIITRSCRAMINHAFKELELNRVEIKCARENIKSRMIPERLGFVQEGIIREAEWIYDHYVDHAIYGMIARDWEDLVK